MYDYMPQLQPNIPNFGFNTPKMGANQQIIKVNGSNGANAYQLPPNSSVLLLDESSPRIFLAQTDGAGYKTVTAYKLEPYVEPQEVSVTELLQRITKLEEQLYEQSNTRNGSKSKSTVGNIKES